MKAQWIGHWDISDHCPVWLVISSKNWGPIPFRLVNDWLEHKEGKQFIENISRCMGRSLCGKGEIEVVERENEDLEQ